MSEPLDPVGAAFVDLKEAVVPHIRLAGVDAAATTVRRRRRARLAVAIAVVLLVPVAGYGLRASLGTGNHAAPAASPKPSPGPRPDQMAAPLDGPLPASFRDGVVPVPDFGLAGCPSGPVTFHNGQWTAGPAYVGGPEPSVSMLDVASGPVEPGASGDAVALLVCHTGEDSAVYQIVAYRFDHDGRPALMGRVAIGEVNHVLTALRILKDGSVRFAEGTQWLTYTWNGTAFVPAGPPVTITLPPTTLVLSAAPTAITQTLTTLAVTVRNDGPDASDEMVVSFRSAAPMTVTGREFLGRVAQQPCNGDVCRWDTAIRPVPPGRSVTGNFQIMLLSPPPPGSTLVVTVIGAVRLVGTQPDPGTANTVTVPIQP
jgi:hypothetical protein